MKLSRPLPTGKDSLYTFHRYIDLERRLALAPARLATSVRGVGDVPGQGDGGRGEVVHQVAGQAPDRRGSRDSGGSFCRAAGARSFQRARAGAGSRARGPAGTRRPSGSCCAVLPVGARLGRARARMKRTSPAKPRSFGRGPRAQPRGAGRAGRRGGYAGGSAAVVRRSPRRRARDRCDGFRGGFGRARRYLGLVLKTRKPRRSRAFKVGDTGLEPVTSALSRRRSPS